MKEIWLKAQILFKIFYYLMNKLVLEKHKYNKRKGLNIN